MQIYGVDVSKSYRLDMESTGLNIFPKITLSDNSISKNINLSNRVSRQTRFDKQGPELAYKNYHTGAL